MPTHDLFDFCKVGSDASFPLLTLVILGLLLPEVLEIEHRMLTHSSVFTTAQLCS